MMGKINNKTLAVFGIGSYLFSVITSAEDLQGNPKFPLLLIALSELLITVFIVLTIIRLWRVKRGLSMVLLLSFMFILIFGVMQEIFSFQYGSAVIILLNISKIIFFISLIWAIVFLWKNEKSNQVKLGKENYEK